MSQEQRFYFISFTILKGQLFSVLRGTGDSPSLRPQSIPKSMCQWVTTNQTNGMVGGEAILRI